MTFTFKVHAATPEVVWKVKDAMKELKEHFEDILKYKVITELEDSDEFPVHMRAKKKTKVEIKKEVGKEYDKVSIEKHDEIRKVREWNTLMSFAIRPPTLRERQEIPEVDEIRRDEKLENRRMKMRKELDEAKEQLWNHRDDEDFGKITMDH